jgi:hypothetical protein
MDRAWEEQRMGLPEKCGFVFEGDGEYVIAWGKPISNTQCRAPTMYPIDKPLFSFHPHDSVGFPSLGDEIHATDTGVDGYIRHTLGIIKYAPSVQRWDYVEYWGPKW